MTEYYVVDLSEQVFDRLYSDEYNRCHTFIYIYIYVCVCVCVCVCKLADRNRG